MKRERERERRERERERGVCERARGSPQDIFDMMVRYIKSAGT